MLTTSNYVGTILKYKKSKECKIMKNVQNDRFIVSVKVGPKGQVTIPIEARRMFDIKEGETLMFMGDVNRGLALIKADELYNIMGDVFASESDKNH